MRCLNPRILLGPSISGCVNACRRFFSQTSSGDGGKLIGYLRVAELKLQAGDEVLDVRPLIAIPLAQPHIVALVRLHETGESMARLVDEQGETVGVITDRKLSEPLFGGER